MRYVRAPENWNPSVEENNDSNKLFLQYQHRACQDRSPRECHKVWVTYGKFAFYLFRVLQPCLGAKMIEDVGKEIVCPKCGERGKVVFERVNVKGKPY